MKWWHATQEARSAEYAERVTGDVADNSSIYGATVTIPGAARDRDRILTHAYPVSWMLKQQALVGALLRNKPTDEPIQSRVYWALALMSAVTDGLFFFNVNDIIWTRAFFGDIEYNASAPFRSYKDILTQRRVGRVWEPVMSPLWDGLDAIRKMVEPGLTDAQLNKLPTAFFGMRPTPVDGVQPAPFFNGPLIGNDYQAATYILPTDSNSPQYCPVYRAQWWNDWIAIPQAQHVPWMHKAHTLWYDPITVLDRRVQTDRNRECDYFWEFEGHRIDEVAEQATQAMGTKGLPGWIARRYRMMAYGYRYAPYSPRQVVPSLPQLIAQAQTSYEHPSAAGNTLTFQRAFDLGAYDVVGDWFASLDIKRAYNVVNEDAGYFSLSGQRYLWIGNQPSNAQKMFLPRDSWEDVKRAKNITEWMDRLTPILMVVTLIADLAQGNYGSAMANWGRSIERAVKKAESTGVPLWETFVEMPNVYLHSLGGHDQQREGLYAYFNTCCGAAEKVMERLTRSVVDCREAVHSVPIFRSPVIYKPTLTLKPSPKRLKVDPQPKAPGRKILGWSAALAAAGAAAYYAFPQQTRRLYRRIR